MRVLGWLLLVTGALTEAHELTQPAPYQGAVVAGLACVLIGHRLARGQMAFDWLLGVEPAPPPYDQDRDEPEHDTLGPAFDFHRHRGRQ